MEYGYITYSVYFMQMYNLFVFALTENLTTEQLD